MNLIRATVLFTAIIAGSISVSAQTSKKTVPKGWHLLDKTDSGFYGISLDKAYELVKGKQGRTVIVAVIDSGIDTTHEDLRPVLWRNPGEIPGNGIDDDKNGYVDDIHGWNFLGGKDGRNVKEDSYEAARLYHSWKKRFENVSDPSKLSETDRRDYTTWLRAKSETEKGIDAQEVFFIKRLLPSFQAGDSIISKDLKKEEYDCSDLAKYEASVREAAMVKQIMLSICDQNGSNEISNKLLLEEFEGTLRKAEAVDSAPPNYRGDIVRDNEDDINDRNYGNNDVMAGTSMHGTHVSGIIAAARGNGVGMDGVADNVRIMALRAVPDGDEHDKDVALAIRYAVDNGARVINMSFGKSFSPRKQWVDEAVRYAESKGVLLVHAAGNDAKNIDTTFNYPSGLLLDGTRPTNWITVGATGPSGEAKSGGLVASFSNYGKAEVDVFAPGVRIYSTIPGGNTYGNQQGTSMAAPVVSGLAAFLLSYYPQLSVQHVKFIIEHSSLKPGFKVSNPETQETVEMASISRTGGIVNALEAVKLAEQVSKGDFKIKTEDVKIKVKDDKIKIKEEKKATKTF
ncbi:MAG TPA: S8 family peptidase [Flavisolibacter sp.]